MNAKKIAGLVGIALVLFFIISQPGNASNVAGGIIDWLVGAANAIVTFVSNVFNH